MSGNILVGDVFSQPDTTYQETDYLDRFVGGGELVYMLSGRCGINLVLEDILKTTEGPLIAYLPLYTCETVVAPFEKNGFDILYYDVGEDMVPIFDDDDLDKSDVVLVCGYFGFVRYDKDKIKDSKSFGKIILEDATHSVFSKGGMSKDADYIAGSLRKWVNVDSGGFAIKRSGEFEARPVDFSDKHLKLRSNIDKFGTIDPERAREYFWKAEFLLREIFSSQKSDKNSIDVIKHLDIDNIIQKRRDNYQYLYEKIDNGYVELIFELDEGDVPSHMTVLSEHRDELSEYLLENNIQPKIFWPIHNTKAELKGSEAINIYNKVISIPCDQRYGEKEMTYVADVINAFTI